MKRGERITNSILEGGLKLSALLAIFLIFLIFIFIFKEALPIFTNPGVRSEVDLRDLFASSVWQPVSDHPRFSLLPLFLGTLKLSLIAILFATPLALGAAIFTAEFAPRALKETIKPGIEILAGIPSVVMGAFALLTLASVLQGIFGWTMRLNALNAGIALGLAIVPTIYSVADDSLRAVPGSFREAAYALGATKLKMIARVILPQAFSGILTGAILSVSRGAGEVAPILFTGAAYFLPYIPKLPTDQFMELGYHIFVLSTQSPDVDKTQPLLYGTILVLLLLTLALNTFAIGLRVRMRRKYGR